MGFMDFLGAALQSGVRTYGALDEQEYERKQREKERQDQLAWRAQQMQMQQEAAQRAQQGQDFDRALATRGSIEGGDSVAPDVFDFLKSQGLGTGFSDTSQFALPQSGPEGQDIMPTIEKLRTRKEQMQETELGATQDERRRQAQFYQKLQANPNASSDIVRQWAIEAGIKPPEPSLGEQTKERERLLDVEHGYRMSEIGAGNAADLARTRIMYPPERFSQEEVRTQREIENRVGRAITIAKEMGSLPEDPKEQLAFVDQLYEQAAAAVGARAKAPAAAAPATPAAPAAPARPQLADPAAAAGSTGQYIMSIDSDAQKAGGYEPLLRAVMANQKAFMADGVDMKQYIAAIMAKAQLGGGRRATTVSPTVTYPQE